MLTCLRYQGFVWSDQSILKHVKGTQISTGREPYILVHYVFVSLQFKEPDVSPVASLGGLASMLSKGPVQSASMESSKYVEMALGLPQSTSAQLMLAFLHVPRDKFSDFWMQGLFPGYLGDLPEEAQDRIGLVMYDDGVTWKPLPFSTNPRVPVQFRDAPPIILKKDKEDKTPRLAWTEWTGSTKLSVRVSYPHAVAHRRDSPVVHSRLNALLEGYAGLFREHYMFEQINHQFISASEYDDWITNKDADETETGAMLTKALVSCKVKWQSVGGGAPTETAHDIFGRNVFGDDRRSTR